MASSPVRHVLLLRLHPDTRKDQVTHMVSALMLLISKGTNMSRICALLSTLSMLLFASAEVIAQSSGPAAPRAPLGSGFTYQGQLRNSGGAVTGTCDFQFGLWDAPGSGSPPTGGTQIGVTHSLSAAVTNGLFTVILNDLNQFGDVPFSGDARWLQIAVRCPSGSGAYAMLSPRQALTATPYALGLKPDATISGLNNTGNLSFGTTTRQMLNLWGAQYGIGVQSYDTYFRTDNGGGFAWFAGGEHSNLHYNPGLFGATLMTLDSGSGLTVSGKVAANTDSAAPGTAISGMNTGSGYGIYGIGNGGTGVIGEGGKSGVVGIASSTTSIGVHGLNTSIGGDGVRGESSGCLFPEGCSTGAGVHGVNTSATGAGVWGQGGVGVQGNSEDGSGVAGQSHRGPGVRGQSNLGAGVSGSSNDSVGVAGWSLSGLGVQGSSPNNNGVQGNSSSATASGVYGENFAGGYGVAGRANGAGTGVLGDNTSPTGYAGYFNGRVGISGGADLAERFGTADNAPVEPGTAMAIDEDHAGKLKVSDVAYDARVVGIISGAGGINTGLVLHQDNALEGDLVVAIAGRVYCKAEAISTPIKPGDLLTTSRVPGHCMKATDRTRAVGAVIGKALTGLDQGIGLVLVIVNLQ